MSRITLVTIGSWGDLFPFIGLGRALIERGHSVRLAASPAWESVAAEAAVPFTGVGKRLGFEELRQHPEIFRRGAVGLRHALGRFIFDQLEQLSPDLQRAMDGADLIVTHPAHVAAQNVAEAMGVRRVVATVFPGLIPSAYTVPGGSWAGPWRGTAGRTANRSAWAAARAVTALLFDRPINGHRRDLGLDRMRSALFKLSLSADGIVVMASRHVIKPPPDWPPRVETTSFVTWDRGLQRPLDRATEAFLADGDGCVLVTLGSSSALDPADFFEVATRAVLEQGARPLVITGPAEPPARLARYPNTHVVSYAPFSLVLPRCRAAIHHAGVGTTVEAVKAGSPQVAVPKGFDQPDTAARIEQLGIGLAVPWRKRRTTLPDALHRVLTQPSFTNRAAALAKCISTDEGVDASADAVERHIPRS